MIKIYTGLPSSGKSLLLADEALSILKRNLKWWRKTGIIRPVISNLKFSNEIEIKYEGFIKYWNNVDELINLRDCDIIWDEIALELSNTNWQNLSHDIRRLLQQHAKRGIEIYANTQSFKSVVVDVRRICNEVLYLNKIIGSRRPTPTKPPVKHIWGIILIRSIDPDTFEAEDKSKYKMSFENLAIIDSDKCKIFDTTQEIKLGDLPPMKHIKHYCENPNCEHHSKPLIKHIL